LSLLPTPLHPSATNRTISLYGTSTFPSQALDLHLEGLTALLLSLKKVPTIRYSRASSLCATLARELNASITSAPDLWDFRRGEKPTTLVIVDRRDDPVTPLLTQWTYQAMVHELLGIDNGRVSLKDAEGVKDDMKVPAFFLRAHTPPS
jgi:hypothetical protein